MAQTRTPDQIWAAALLLADMANSTFATAAEGRDRINKSLAGLWADITRSKGSEYLREPRTISTTANSPTTELGSVGSAITNGGASFLKLISLEVDLGSGPFDIRPLYQWEMRHAFANRSGWGNGNVFYTLENSVTGAKLRWWPTPTAVHSVTAWVIPSAPVFSTGTETWDFVNGWDDYVAHDVAIYLLGREQSDTSLLMAERARILEGILGNLGRKHNEPDRVRDVRMPRMGFGAWNGRNGGDWGWR